MFVPQGTLEKIAMNAISMHRWNEDKLAEYIAQTIHNWMETPAEYYKLTRPDAEPFFRKNEFFREAIAIVPESVENYWMLVRAGITKYCNDTYRV